MKTFLLICLSMMSFALSAQINIGKITSLEIDGPIQVEIEEAADAQLTILSEEDLLFYETNGSALVIIASYVEGRETPSIRITLPKLTALHTTGAVVLGSKGVFDTRKMTLRIGGQSVVDMEVDVEELVAEVSSQSVLNLEGQADLLEVSATGQSVLDAHHLKSADTTASAKGKSVITLTPAAKMDTQIEVGSIVNY